MYTQTYPHPHTTSHSAGRHDIYTQLAHTRHATIIRFRRIHAHHLHNGTHMCTHTHTQTSHTHPTPQDTHMCAHTQSVCAHTVCSAQTCTCTCMQALQDGRMTHSCQAVIMCTMPDTLAMQSTAGSRDIYESTQLGRARVPRAQGKAPSTQPNTIVVRLYRLYATPAVQAVRNPGCTGYTQLHMDTSAKLGVKTFAPGLNRCMASYCMSALTEGSIKNVEPRQHIRCGRQAGTQLHQHAVARSACNLKKRSNKAGLSLQNDQNRLRPQTKGATRLRPPGLGCEQMRLGNTVAPWRDSTIVPALAPRSKTAQEHYSRQGI